MLSMVWVETGIPTEGVRDRQRGMTLQRHMPMECEVLSRNGSRPHQGILERNGPKNGDATHDRLAGPRCGEEIHAS